MAAPERPRLELLGQQLPARQAPAGVRHPLLELDTTNLPAALHRDFLNVALHNALVHPGEVEVLGTPVDLGRITGRRVPRRRHRRPHHAVGERVPHGAAARRDLAVRPVDERPHRALVNPPGNPKARYQTNDALPDDPDAFLAGAQTSQGTWWTDWGAWLGERSGGQRPAPQAPGSERHPPLGRAPGTYVLQ
jgi:polyhydroxyalkanoate synthase